MPDFSDMSISEIASEVHNLLSTTLFTLKETPVTLLSIVIFLIFLTVFIFAGGFTKRVLQSRVLPRFDIEEGLRYTLARMSQYFIITIGFLISFQFIGIDLSSLAVIFGLLSVGIGFGLQNITSNFISGLIVLFERPISVGDRVSVGGVEGDVIEINIRATKIKTLNNISIIVPNSEFVASNVVNYSHGDTSYRLDLNVGVSYSSDLDLVLKALREVMDENPKIMKNPEAQIHLVEFGDSSWNMQIRAWIPYVKDYPVIRDNINQAIVRKFRDYNIEIPFPQRDLHVRSSIPIPYKKGENEKENGEKSE